MSWRWMLILAITFAACGPTIKQAAMEKPAPEKVLSVESLPVLAIRPQTKVESFTDEWPFTRLPELAQAMRLRIPASDRVQYLIIKTYAVSPATHMHFGVYTHWPVEQPWMAPVRLLRLRSGADPEDMLTAADFELNTNMRTIKVLGFSGPAGETWKQAAIRLHPGDGLDLLLVIDEQLVGARDWLPWSYWSYRGASGVIPLFIAGMPISVPVPNTPRFRTEMFYGRVGLVQIDLVSPEHLLATAAGPRNKREGGERFNGGDELKGQTFAVRLPEGEFIRQEDRDREYLRWRFYQQRSDGSELRLLVSDVPAPGVNIPDQLYQALLDEMNARVENLEEVHQQVELGGVSCMKFRARGKLRTAYHMPWQAIDLVCLLDDPKRPDLPRGVLIGGAFIAAPGHESSDTDLAPVKAFVRSLRFF